MKELFSYNYFDNEGKKILTISGEKNPDMGMDITIYRLQAGEERRFQSDYQEIAILLVEGEVTYTYENICRQVIRDHFVEDGPYCLHMSRGFQIKIQAIKDSEILVQKAENLKTFEAVFYEPVNCREETFGERAWEGKMKRLVRTIFDYENAPYSNMVMGEVITFQGGWSSYAPHSHIQPEVYYYRYEKQEGFGACFIGEKVFLIQDGSCAKIPGGLTHPQVTAPGYPMYYCWMIRHLDDNPWTKRVIDSKYKWLDEKGDYKWNAI